MHAVIIDWLQEIEFKANFHRSEEKYHDLSEKRATMEKLRGIKKEALAQSDMFARFRAKVSEMPESAQEPYLPVFTRFEDLTKTLDLDIASLESMSLEHEAYSKEYNEVCSLLNKARASLEGFTESGGEKGAAVKRLNDLRQFLGNLAEIQGRIQHAKELGEQAMETTTPDGRDQIKSECRRLQTEYESLLLHSQESERNICNCIENWNAFEQAHDAISKALEASAANLKAEPDTDNNTPADLKRGKVNNLQTSEAHSLYYLLSSF
jgi:hypothetical protein